MSKAKFIGLIKAKQPARPPTPPNQYPGAVKDRVAIAKTKKA